jgi:hypothetical protein
VRRERLDLAAFTPDRNLANRSGAGRVVTDARSLSGKVPAVCGQLEIAGRATGSTFSGWPQGSPIPAAFRHAMITRARSAASACEASKPRPLFTPETTMTRPPRFGLSLVVEAVGGSRAEKSAANAYS